MLVSEPFFIMRAKKSKQDDVHIYQKKPVHYLRFQAAVLITNTSS